MEFEFDINLKISYEQLDKIRIIEDINEFIKSNEKISAIYMYVRKSDLRKYIGASSDVVQRTESHIKGTADHKVRRRIFR